MVHYLYYPKNLNSSASERGFSLIEVMVSLGLATLSLSTALLSIQNTQQFTLSKQWHSRAHTAIQDLILMDISLTDANGITQASLQSVDSDRRLSLAPCWFNHCNQQQQGRHILQRFERQLAMIPEVRYQITNGLSGPELFVSWQQNAIDQRVSQACLPFDPAPNRGCLTYRP